MKHWATQTPTSAYFWLHVCRMSPSPSPSSVTIGLDVGGTDIKGCLVAEPDNLLMRKRWTTSAVRDSRVVDALRDHVFELVSAADRNGRSVAGVGVSVPGMVDEVAQVAMEASNFAWRDAPLSRLLRDATGLPVCLGHDSRAGCLAELRQGAARHCDTALFVPIGSGIGSSVSIAGRILSDPRVGEIGHCTVDPGGELCACGGRGCLETVASARGISRSYESRTGRPATGKQIAALVSSGDAQATEVWTKAVETLASVLAPCIALFAPDAVVVGGGLSSAGATFLSPLRDAIEKRLALATRPQVVEATFGRWSACVGAALLSKDSLA